MTLKQHLEAHKISATPDQRSQIGIHISKLEHNYCSTMEDRFNVKVYDESFLNSDTVSLIIINYLSYCGKLKKD